MPLTTQVSAASRTSLSGMSSSPTSIPYNRSDKTLERRMARQQPDENRIELKGVRTLAVFDGVIDNPIQ